MILIRFLLMLGFIVAKNSCPIVLIHGFMGWGEDEMGNYNYWGGKSDYVQMLTDQGHSVYEVSVGPVSSNWERAVEVYYQLKGGQVDYGKNHSKKYSIIQKPKNKNYKGLYPQWDASNPIHLIGHSMGGQTARMLDYLLTQNIYENEDLLEDSKLLGGVTNHSILSITSISTPHNGTTLAEIVRKTIPFIQYFVGIAGVVGTDFYSFDLEQWGFRRMLKESWADYISRMRNHKAWSTKNISSWDLSLSGAEEINSFLQISPNIYYFSIITSTTIKKEGSSQHFPSKGTSIITKTRSKILGSRSGYWANGSETDSTWYENDGVVNSISMYAPTSKLNGPDPSSKYFEDELLMRGQWYWMKFTEMDHWNIIGHLGNKERKKVSKDFFLYHAKRLKLLALD